jgi:3-oxoadipate enol-lactonase
VSEGLALDLAFEDSGAGLPVVLLHAFPLDASMWQPQLVALMHTCRCIAPDMRGFGSSPVQEPYSMDQYADDVAALLDLMQIDRAVICGLSMGGYIALAFWRRHRARARGLVLADTRAGADAPEGRAKRDEMIQLVKHSGVAALAERQITGLVGTSTREHHPEIGEDVRGLMLGASVPGVIGALEAMRDRPDSTPLLATIDVPTLIVVGEEDVVTPVAEARAMHAAVRDSRLEIIERAGHLSNLERPSAFNTVLSEFVGRLLYN